MIALVALAALGAAGYRIIQHEQRLSAETQALTASGDAADIAIETIGDIKAALHAYVAPGQGQAFWTARAGMLLDKLRGSLLELDRVAASHGAPITETLDLSDRLAAAEQRAREHVRNGQPLLAGDVIFTDARDLLDAIRVQVARARGQLAQTAGDAAGGDATRRGDGRGGCRGHRGARPACARPSWPGPGRRPAARVVIAGAAGCQRA